MNTESLRCVEAGVSQFRSKFGSSALSCKLQDILRAVWTSEVKKGKRRSNSPSPSSDRIRLPLEDTVSNDEGWTKPASIMPFARLLVVELAQIQDSSGRLPRCNLTSRARVFGRATQKKQESAKLPPIQERPRIGTYMPSEVSLALMQGYTTSHPKHGITCPCDGHCLPSTSGSSRQSFSSSSSSRP